MVQQHVNTPPVSTTSWADKRKKKKKRSHTHQASHSHPPRDKNTSAHVEQVLGTKIPNSHSPALTLQLSPQRAEQTEKPLHKRPNTSAHVEQV